MVWASEWFYLPSHLSLLIFIHVFIYILFQNLNVFPKLLFTKLPPREQDLHVLFVRPFFPLVKVSGGHLVHQCWQMVFSIKHLSALSLQKLNLNALMWVLHCQFDTFLATALILHLTWLNIDTAGLCKQLSLQLIEKRKRNLNKKFPLSEITFRACEA